jgi:predicted enzyme related to lactoylglutathione lyase
VRRLAKHLPRTEKNIDSQAEDEMLQAAPIYAYIPAKDVARARRFYEDTLGFQPKQANDDGVTYEFAHGTAGFLYETPNAGTSQASQAFWQVADIESEVAGLKARGVTFEHYDMPGMDANGIMTDGGIRAAWYKDTEGNIMAVIQSDY